MTLDEALVKIEQLRDEVGAAKAEAAEANAQAVFRTNALKKLADMDAAAMKTLSKKQIAAHAATPGGAGWTEPGDCALNVLMGTI